MKQEKAIIKESVEIEIKQALLNNNLNGEVMQCLIIRHMTAKKPPVWFQQWSDSVYQKQPPAWFQQWSENVYQKKPPAWFEDFEIRNNERFDKLEKRMDQNGLKPYVKS